MNLTVELTVESENEIGYHRYTIDIRLKMLHLFRSKYFQIYRNTIQLHRTFYRLLATTSFRFYFDDYRQDMGL
jgi:hypothetical protein